MTTLPGFTSPGGPVDVAAALDAWCKIYLVLMMIRSEDRARQEKISEMRDALAELNELVIGILGAE